MESIILFDFGGVVGKDHQDPAEKILMDFFSVDRETIDSLLSEKSVHGTSFRENKITEKQFWDTVHGLSNCNKKIEDYASLSLLFGQTYILNIELLEVIKKLRSNNKVGILTNIDYARSNYLVEGLKIKDYFDLYYPSYLFNSHKRDKLLWKLVDEEINRAFPHSRILYVDDRIEHVESAKSIGWHGIQYIDNEKIVLDIEKYLL